MLAGFVTATAKIRAAMAQLVAALDALAAESAAANSGVDEVVCIAARIMKVRDGVPRLAILLKERQPGRPASRLPPMPRYQWGRKCSWRT